VTSALHLYRIISFLPAVEGDVFETHGERSAGFA